MSRFSGKINNLIEKACDDLHMIHMKNDEDDIQKLQLIVRKPGNSKPGGKRDRSNDSLTKWDVSFDEFQNHSGMPAMCTKLFNWQMTQMSKGNYGLDARIEKYPDESDTGRERKQRLLECIKKESTLYFNQKVGYCF